MSDEIVDFLRAHHQQVPSPQHASYYSQAADEIVRLRAQVELFHQDWVTMNCAAMYGCPPGGWSDPERKATFVAEIDDAIMRHAAYEGWCPRCGKTLDLHDKEVEAR